MSTPDEIPNALALARSAFLSLRHGLAAAATDAAIAEPWLTGFIDAAVSLAHHSLPHSLTRY